MASRALSFDQQETECERRFRVTLRWLMAFTGQWRAMLEAPLFFGDRFLRSAKLWDRISLVLFCYLDLKFFTCILLNFINLIIDYNENAPPSFPRLTDNIHTAIGGLTYEPRELSLFILVALLACHVIYCLIGPLKGHLGEIYIFCVLI